MVGLGKLPHVGHFMALQFVEVRAINNDSLMDALMQAAGNVQVWDCTYCGLQQLDARRAQDPLNFVMFK